MASTNNDQPGKRDILGTLSGGETGIPQDGSMVNEFLTYLLYIYDTGAVDPFIEFVESGPRMLLFIHYRKQCHPSQISTALRLSRPHVASSLKELEEKGLIRRETDAQNRRQVFVTLTEAGEAAFKKSTDDMVALFIKWLTILGPEATHLLKVLELTAKALVTADGKIPAAGAGSRD